MKYWEDTIISVFENIYWYGKLPMVTLNEPNIYLAEYKL